MEKSFTQRVHYRFVVEGDFCTFHIDARRVG